jgi:hypothetical protein
VCTKPQELESLRRLYKNEKYILAQRGDTLKVGDERSGLWVTFGRGSQGRGEGALPYPCDAWAAFCPLIVFIHFCGWAAKNILTFENSAMIIIWSGMLVLRGVD